MATDSCCSWLSEGVFYDYGSFDNAKFYELFTGENREEEISEETQPDLQAYTPQADDFVRIIDYIPEVDVALAYATTDNFTQQTIYDFFVFRQMINCSYWPIRVTLHLFLIME